MLASLVGLTAQLGCANLIGLDAFTPDPDGGDEGTGGGTGSGGSGTGGGSGECENDQGAGDLDSGCTAAKPFCDGGVCKECMENVDCNDDDNCTADSCVDNACTTTPTDQLVLMDRTTANGSFEDFDDSSGNELAVGWLEEGGAKTGAMDTLPLTYDCAAGCNFLGTLDPETSAASEQGSRIMWLGSFENWADLAESPLLQVPANTASLRVVITRKIVTQESPNDAEHDTYRVTLVSDDGNELGIIHEGSNLEAPSVDTAEFDYDAIDQTFLVPAPWQVEGQPIRLRLESDSNNTDGLDGPDPDTDWSTDGTDFGFDDIRIVANLICN